LAAERRRATADVLIARSPDVALDALREAAHGAVSPGDRLIAASFDALCGVSGDAGWSQALLQPQPAFAAAHQALLAALRTGDFATALAQELPPGLSPSLALTLLRLRSLAALAAGDPARADRELQAAIEQAHAAPFERVELLALQSVAHRRQGDGAAAVLAWQEAVTSAVQLARRGLRDPRGWERLGYLRPTELAWPQELTAVLGQRPRWPATVALLAAIGRWRLERDEVGAALLAYKQAEVVLIAAGLDDGELQWLRIEQARVLARMGQHGAALALLAEPGAQTNALGCAARGTLGAIELERGRVDLARALLRRAVEEGAGVDWPDRALAIADLGVALLVSGEHDGGLTQLRRAESLFAQRGDIEHQLLALRNQLMFYEELGHQEEAAAVLARLAALEQR
jgi:tetratricopeptide (TPR) repeat protein